MNIRKKKKKKEGENQLKRWNFQVWWSRLRLYIQQTNVQIQKTKKTVMNVNNQVSKADCGEVSTMHKHV